MTFSENFVLQEFGTTTIHAVLSTTGSRTGDMLLDFSSSVAFSAEKLSTYVTLEQAGGCESFIVRSFGGAYPNFYGSMHEWMRSSSAEFKKATQPLKIQIQTVPLPDEGIIVLPNDEDPLEQQLVMEINPDTVRLYYQSVCGYQAHMGNDPCWVIWRSGTVVFDRHNLTPAWQKVASAIATDAYVMSTSTRQEHKRFQEYAVPFHTALIDDPNLEWVCSI